MVRRRPTHQRSCVLRRVPGAPGRRRWRPRRGRGSAEPPRGSAPSWSATSVPNRSGPRTRLTPCGCPAWAGRARPRPHSAWRRERRRPAPRPSPARSPSPAGRSATHGPCRRVGAARRPWHRRDGPGPCARRAHHGCAPNEARCRAAHRPSHPTVRSGARTSPTGSPRPAGGRSRSCPVPSRQCRPRSEAGAPLPAPGGRSSGSSAGIRGA
jgi:hypothetical protein